MKIVWQQNSDNLQNADNLGAIGQWWSKLATQEITWQQRLIPEDQDITAIDWETENNFDEKLILVQPQLRGITIYWSKNQQQQERNITVRKLELDTEQQKLYIYPQSQPQVLIRVGLAEIVYHTIELNNPSIVGGAVKKDYLLLLRDKTQKLEVKVTLSSDNLIKLLDSLKKK
ncbi:MAG TPA: hypothetical protein ACFCUY_00355 [Xenococcaceae cyanobacterium]|jgi:hypothetical protein